MDLDAAITALGGGMASSTVLERKAAAMRERDFAPGFKAALHHKDLGIAHAAAREAGVVTPATAVVTELMASLVARGGGDLDHSALVAITAALSGRS